VGAGSGPLRPESYPPSLPPKKSRIRSSSNSSVVPIRSIDLSSGSTPGSGIYTSPGCLFEGKVGGGGKVQEGGVGGSSGISRPAFHEVVSALAITEAPQAEHS
jgi:hypothetical protein